MIKRINRIISFLLGILFLFSALTKILSLSTYSILDSFIGYVNAILILLAELYFGIMYLFNKMKLFSIIACLLFILLLTIFVLLNKDLVDTCMCFGTIIEIKPDLMFIIKNILILIAVGFTFLTSLKNKQVNKC